MPGLNVNQKNEIVVGCVLVALASVAVVLRFYAKLKRKRGLQLDDWLALVSLILIFSLLIELIIWATVGGSGEHISEVTPAELAVFFKMLYANELSYVACTPCIKLCILAFYRGIFSTRRFRLIVTIAVVFITAFCIAFEFATIFQCSPVSAAWNKSLLMDPSTHCFNTNDYFLSFQIINIALDIFVLVLPIPIIWGLNRGWPEKLALTGVFTLGGFVCAASIYRIVTLFYIQNDDVTFTIYLATIWTFVEPCLGLLCACLPIIRGLFPIYHRQNPARQKHHESYKLNKGGKPDTESRIYHKMPSPEPAWSASSNMLKEDRSSRVQSSWSNGITMTTTIEVL